MPGKACRGSRKDRAWFAWRQAKRLIVNDYYFGMARAIYVVSAGQKSTAAIPGLGLIPEDGIKERNNVKHGPGGHNPPNGHPA